ncbi:MAG: NPCBM/NEW2 domain-containing protein [Romboutsia sp.]|nr:NPCBM/NEW2 domain-containing protein [Romboutsia sp.]
MNKKAIGLVLTGLIVGSSITAFAAGGRKIEVFDNVKKVVVNKINKPFTKGEEPFTYNGRTYVPLRYVSEALGEDVNWDGKTGTVYIGETYSASYGYWGKTFNHMNQTIGISYAHDTHNTAKNHIGKEFSNYLIISSSYKSIRNVEFPLNGQYTNFTSSLATEYTHRDQSGEGSVRILLDGKEVYKTSIKNSDMPKQVSIDLRGANKITFEYKGGSDSWTGSSIIFGDGKFKKK